jgi:DNA-directed RNA polymerase subunit alpha
VLGRHAVRTHNGETDVTETLIDLRALLVEREDFEGSMVSRLREGLAQAPSQIRNLKEINEILLKRLAVAAGPLQKKIHLKIGVCQFYLGHMQTAVDHLKQSEGPLAAFFLGRAHAAKHEHEEALKAFDKSEKSGYAAQQVQLQRAGVLRLQGHLAEVKPILAKVKDMATHNAEYHFQDGAIAEAEGDVPRATKSYERSVDLDPAHTGALFRLGFLNDLAGNDDEAISYYERCLKHPPVSKGTLYNLGVLYEDSGMYEKATDCFKRLKRSDPHDDRAKLFYKDAEASVSQFYSPDDEKVSIQWVKVMEMPITDFELSVRSRNCLKRMNIRTLGDLTRVNEAQLLASKNFGETSLDEIRAIMVQKGLRVGQSLDQGQQHEFKIRAHSNLSPEEQAMMGKPVSELNLSVRARKCMNRLGITSIGELCQRTSDELMEAKNFGVTSLNEVKEKLTQMGLKLRGD